MKFRILAIITILLCLFSLCFSKKDKSVTEITFSSWGSESEVSIIKPLIKDFEQKNPDIKVKFLHIPQNYFQKVHLLFVSNTQPDVLFINNIYLPIYANAKVLEPLENYFTKKELSQFYKKALESLKWKNSLYAIPRDISNQVVFYNKDLFKKYNIPMPNNNWNQNDFLKVAQLLTHRPNVFGISFEEEPYFYLPYLTINGGGFSNDKITSVQTKNSLVFYANLRKKYHVAPTKSETGSATMAQMFLQGKLAMHTSGRWLVPKYRQEANFDWDVINFPNGTQGAKIPLDSSGWALAKNSNHKKEAIKFIKYISSKENISKITTTGLIVPARIDVANSKIFLDNERPKNSKIFTEIIETSVPTQSSINYNEILDKVKKQNEYLFN